MFFSSLSAFMGKPKLLKNKIDLDSDKF